MPNLLIGWRQIVPSSVFLNNGNGGINVQPLIHGILLAFGLILPLGVQNVFIFNQGATHRKFTKSLPAIVTAGVCDTILIYLAVAGVSVIVFSFEWLKISLF